YPLWAAFEIFSSTVARGYWVHNVEHGAIVLLYRPDAGPDLVSALIDACNAIPGNAERGHKRALLTPDPLLIGTVAIVAANVTLEGGCVDRDAILDFVAAHRNHALEDSCAPGRTF